MFKLSYRVLTLCAACMLTTFTVHANDISTSTNPKTMPYGDNPNIFRVLAYKSGQSLDRLGNAMQRGADNSAVKIDEKWQDTKAFGSEQSKVLANKADQAKTATEQKIQQGKDAIVGTNGGTVPIEQGTLSQPSANMPTPSTQSANP